MDSFLEFTNHLPSPEIFRRWTAYSIIAGALERRVWTNINGSILYPNLFILLIGPPGTGKSMAIKEAATLWASTGKLTVGPNAMTKAAFVDQLSGKPKTYLYEGKTVIYNSLLIAAQEFGTLLPENDTKFLNVLNDIFDCNKIFEDSTRGGGLIRVDRPHLNLIGGTQPMYLGDLLPESAYGQGFTSRIIMVYSGHRVIKDMFKSSGRDAELEKALRQDLRIVAGLIGGFEWTVEAKEIIEEWNRTSEKDAPSHMKLQNYNTRRVVHAAKLAMTIAVIHKDRLLVNAEDIIEARKQLILAESFMPEIFKEMTSGSDAADLSEFHRFVFGYCERKGVEGIPEHILIHRMSQKIPVNRISYFLETMISGKMLESIGLNLSGQRKFKALPLSRFN